MTTVEQKSSISNSPYRRERRSLGSRNFKFVRRKRRDISQTYWALDQRVRDTGMRRPLRMDLLSRFGDFSMAYSTAVQPRLNYFGDQNGYIAYRQRWGMSFVLGLSLIHI